MITSLQNRQTETRIGALPIEERMRLYNEAWRLRREFGYGAHKISKKLGINKGVVDSWFYDGSCPQYNKIKFLPIPSKELSYVIGTLLGDACIWRDKNSNNACRIELKAKDKDFVERFASCLTKLFNKNTMNSIKNTYDGYWKVIYGSRLFFNFFETLNLDDMSKWICGYETEFLKGLFDSEGSVNIGAKDIFYVSVALANTDKELLNFVKNILENKLCIKCPMVLAKEKNSMVKGTGNEIYSRNKDVWRLSITENISIETFMKNIGFTISRKQQKLEDAIKIKKFYPDRRKSAERWRELYEIIGREWVKINSDIT